MISSYTAWSTHQADSSWLLYMEHIGIIIADIGGQALDMVLHHIESAQKNITVKALTHSHI